MKKELFFVLFLFFVSFSLISQSLKNKDEFFVKAVELRNTKMDSTGFYYDKSYEYQQQNNDTLGMIRAVFANAYFHKHIADYSGAYDYCWKGLHLAESIKNDIWIAKINQELGGLYNIYGKRDTALRHLDLARAIVLRNYKEKKVQHNNVQAIYHGYFNVYRSAGNNEVAEKYLDSSYAIHSSVYPNRKNYFLEVETANILMRKEKYKEALEVIEELNVLKNEYNKRYSIIAYFIKGRALISLGRYKESEESFKTSLELIDKFNAHHNYKSFNYMRLSELAIKNKDFKKAYHYANMANILDREDYGVNFEKNAQFLNIKDAYRIEKEQQLLKSKEDELMILQQESSISKLKQLVLIVSLIFIVLSAFLIIKGIRFKHKAEQKALKEKQKIELETKNSILEVKNKELTLSALQLIEKEEFVSDIAAELKLPNDKVDVQKLKNKVKTLQRDPNNNWAEFEARFVAINQDFYKNLKAEFPDLGPTDLKVCALLKLNFSSKKMATLLGISVESSHSSRHRVRKKLGLDRNVNLVDFINKF